jgi:ComF family protein
LVRAPFAHDAGARTLVHLLKYEGQSSLAEPLALLMLGSLDVRPDLVVPIPLHPGRQRSRGYNQAALLGRSLAREGGWAFDQRAARRIRPTKALAESTTREERREIVAGAFAADAARVGGLSVLLVDDVVTTGATLGACADALADAGAALVSAVTFSRA